MMLAWSNYGTKLVLDGKHPRKELLRKLGASHADKIYRDLKDGSTVHTGYVVRREWFELYKLEPMRKADGQPHRA